MNSLLRLATAAAVMVLMAAWSVNATGSVRISSDIDNETASFEVKPGNAGGTEVKLDIPAVEMVPTSLEGRSYQKIQLPTAEHIFEGEIAEDGKPDLPVITTNIAIPDMAGIGFTVDYESYDIISDVDIAPAQPPKLESSAEVPPFTIDSEFYSRDEFYPSDIAEVRDPVIMRDVRMVQVAIYPVQYNPARKQLKVYRNISVNLTYDSENVVNPKTHRAGFISEAFMPLYRSTVANFDDLYSTLDVRRGGILIIAKDALIDTLRTLANWKHRKGYYVYLTPTTEVAPGGYPNYSQVYNYINTAYDTWEVPPEYVMIVGDNSGTYSIPDYPYSYYSSDHEYSCVDGTDYIPDLAISRLSVSTMTDLRIALAKILDYENDPNMENVNHWTYGFSSAGNIGSVTPRLTVLWVRELLMEYGFTSVDTCFGYGSTAPNPLMNTYFNNGPSIISYRGWGFTDHLGAPAYYINDLNQIPNNNNLGILASLTCGTGDFGASLCFGEHWIRMGYSTTQYKGGPCFYGSTDHSTHTRWNNPIMVGYYWGIFKENNYHFAAAAVRGKIQQYNTFPRYINPGGDIEKYFHTYNMLGDPELSVRTKPPIYLIVTRPDQIDYGLNHVYVNVMDNAEHVVEGAYVTLYKESGGEEELWVVGRTDANGDVALVFDPPSEGDMMLTVSGRDLFPYQGTIEIVSGNTIVGYDTYTIDDDNSGYSSGNNDGVANPGETVELSINLKNFGSGQTASGVSAFLETLDENSAKVNWAESDFPNIPPDQSVTSSNPYVVKIMPQAQEGDMAHLKITATDSGNNTWESSVEIPVSAPKFVVTGVTFSDANGRLDPGETLDMILTIQNIGSLDAVNVSGSVYTMDDYTAMADPNCSFGDIASGASGNNSGDVLIISSVPETFDGHTINLMLHTGTAAGYEAEIPFTVHVGQVLSTDPTGPDAYGYHMFDNTDIDYAPAPTYDWAEIAPSLGGQGTRLYFVGGTDDGSNVITLPFDFVYYGENYGALMVCTNGFAALDTFAFDIAGNYWWNFFNWPIPDPGSARGQISPFWDDLSYTGNYGVFTWYDQNDHRFIIEWYSMTHRNTGSYETFEMIITDPQYHPTLTGDSEITFHYKTIVNNDGGENYSSVGYESWSELMGQEYTYDNTYSPGSATLANNRSIKITTNTGWGGVKGLVDLNNSGFNGGVTVTTSYGRFRITSEDGSYWLRNVPPGTVDITANIRGWFPATNTDVNVTADVTTDNVDFSLTQCDVPTNLEASQGLGDRIELTWDAVSHPDLDGYNVYRAHWQNGDYVKLNTDPVSVTAYADSTLPDNDVYWYAVTAAYSGSYGNAESIESNKDYGSTEIITGIEEETQAVPREFFISQNYPNPFNPTTNLSYGLPRDSEVRIDIFNVLGQRVLTLVDEFQTAGFKTVSWDGRDSAGGKVSTGVYFYTIEAGNYHDSKKMLLIK